MSEEREVPAGGTDGAQRGSGSSLGAVSGAEHGQGGSVPGGDLGTGMGGDEEYSNELRDVSVEQEGIAGRAARQGTSEQDDDKPAGVPGQDAPTTPGYTP